VGDLERSNGKLHCYCQNGLYPNMPQKYVDWIFCYLDRSYLLPKQDSLRDIAVDLFRSTIFEHPKLNDRIIDGACDLIAVDRAGQDLDRDMFSKAIKMFHEMQVYTKHFEPRMLDFSQTYVKNWSDIASGEMTLPEYVKSALALMKSELQRVEIFSLDGSTRRDLLTLLEDHIISRKASRLGMMVERRICTSSLIQLQQTRTNSLISLMKTLSSALNCYILCLSAAS